MGKSEAGPDMLDCMAYLREIERQTGKRITVLLEPDGFGPGPRWSITLLATSAVQVEIAEGRGLAVAGRWPHRQHRTFAGALLALLALLDGEIGKAMFQEVLDIK